MQPDNVPASSAALINLIVANYHDLFRYVFSLHPHADEAQEVVQEAVLEITSKFSEYDPERPFLPWACGFAYRVILRFRDRNARRKMEYLPADVLELLALEREEEEPILMARLVALDDCLERLPSEARRLVQYRYTEKVPLDDLADRLGLSRRTLLRRLEHVRRVLYECIDLRTAKLGELS